MFDNIGGKIKSFSMFVCIVGIITAVCIGISFILNGNAIIGFVILAVGSIVSWLGSFFSYGFGQLVENSDIIAAQFKRENIKYEKNIKKQQEAKKQKQNQEARNMVSSVNVSDNEYIDIPCPICGERLSFLKSDFISNEVLECPLCISEFSTKMYK